MAEGKPAQQLTPRAERTLSYIVISGAIIGVALFAVGIIYALSSSPIPNPSQNMSLGMIVSSIASMDAMGFIGMGVIVVVATPLIRVLSTIFYFSQRDRRLVILPIVTFVLIIVGFILMM